MHSIQRGPPRSALPATPADQHAEALEHVQVPALQVWYEPGADLCYYETAFLAAKAANKRLRKARFSAIEELRLSTDLDPKVIVKYLEDGVKKMPDNDEADEAASGGKRVFQRRAKQLTRGAKQLGLGLIKVAQALDPIISVLLPSSPEYAIPYACLKVIFQFIVDNTTDRPEEIKGYLDQLSEILEKLMFHHDINPTGPMKLLLAQIYVHVLDFLERMVEYSNLTSGGRLIKAVNPKTWKDYKFKDTLADIKKLISKLEEYSKMSMQAMQKEEFLLTREFAAVMPILYQISRDSSHATQLATLAQATAIAQMLLDILLPDGQDLEDELELWQTVSFRLSPGDHWDKNGMLDELTLWGGSEDNLFFVVGPCGSKDSWVTSFSLDLIRMLQSQEVLLTFALCDRPYFENWCPTMLMKRLIGQLLEQNLLLVLEEPQIFNVRNFQKSKEIHQVWQMFEKIAARLNSLVIVIDRIDCCREQENTRYRTGEDLIRNLMNLAAQHRGKLKIIITGADEPPQSLCEDIRLRYVLIDTQKRPRRRDWDFDDDDDDEDDEDDGGGSCDDDPDTHMRV